MVTIRLARTGAKKRPFYHLTVAESSVKRDGKFIERLGFFNPIAVGQSQRLKVDLERVDHWLSVGAKPSERAGHLIREARKSADAAPVQAAAEATETTAEA